MASPGDLSNTSTRRMPLLPSASRIIIIILLADGNSIFFLIIVSSTVLVTVSSTVISLLCLFRVLILLAVTADVTLTPDALSCR